MCARVTFILLEKSSRRSYKLGRVTGSAVGESMIHLYLFMRFSIFRMTRMSETVTFGREVVAYARCLAGY